ncbi:MAG: DUF86 domain-containing protein [Methylococcaceae bacterium]|nr:DUF86 domain-containing protein [Methylococcaceae bacterium]
MSKISPELRTYLHEVQAHAENIVVELDEISELNATTNLSNRDFYAAERLLQVLTEACIGVAKHWVKLLNKTAPVDAYQAFELLLGLGRLSHQELLAWKRIIGMRNALEHDYLNVDRQIVLGVLQQQAYRQLLEFIRRAGEAMNGEALF